MTDGSSGRRARWRYVDAGRVVVLAVPILVRMRWRLDRDGFDSARTLADHLAKHRRTIRLKATSVAEIVHRVAILSPDRLNCLPQALTLWCLTRSAGHQTELKIGVAPRSGTSEALAAHAWVELDGKALGENTTRYVTLSSDQHVMTGGLPGRRDPQPAAKKATR